MGAQNPQLGAHFKSAPRQGAHQLSHTQTFALPLHPHAFRGFAGSVPRQQSSSVNPCVNKFENRPASASVRFELPVPTGGQEGPEWGGGCCYTAQRQQLTGLHSLTTPARNVRTHAARGSNYPRRHGARKDPHGGWGKGLFNARHRTASIDNTYEPTITKMFCQHLPPGCRSFLVGTMGTCCG